MVGFFYICIQLKIQAMNIRPVRFDPEFFRDLIDYKDGTNEQAKIFSEFLPEIPTPPTPPTPEPDFQYEIGEYVASEGGVIFHRWLSNVAYGTPNRGNFQNYLVVDTVDVGANIAWSSLSANVDANSLFDGAANTAAMISAGAGGGIIAGTAAVLCNDSTNNGKSDWYLPANEELFTLWANRLPVEQGMEEASGSPIGPYLYWSSSQWYYSLTGDPAVAGAVSFFSGTVSGATKTDASFKYVRAIRRFNIETTL